MSKNNGRVEKALGMDRRISRRDFLNSSLLASGGLLLTSAAPLQLLGPSPRQDDWTGYGGVGDYANANGNTWEVLNTGHSNIRERVLDDLPPETIDTGETFDCVVVGGGISGLAAALFLRRQAPRLTCLVLDNHPSFGGEAKRNEFIVEGQRLIAHQGSAYFPVPYPYSFIGRFYESLGMKSPRFEYQKWSGAEKEMPLSRTPYQHLDPATYGLYFGAKFGKKPGMWLLDPWRKKLEGAPISATARAELLRYHSGTPQDPRDQPPQWEGDEISRRLDTITLEQYLIQRYAISQETVRAFLCPDEGSGYGLGPDALSAYTAYAADMLHPLDDSDATGGQMFPGGNTGFARLITKTLIPESIPGPVTLEAICRNLVNFSMLDRPGSPARIRLRSTAIWVKHNGDLEKSDSVTVAYLRDGKLYRVKARSVVMAGGSWTTKHVVRDLGAARRDAYDQFYRVPCLMANIALRNWRPLYKLGITGARWFEGLGWNFELRKLATFGPGSPIISPDSPVVLTLKVLYAYPGLSIQKQGERGRNEILSTPFREYERRIREQLSEMFSAGGFDPARDIAGIILNRWGHAYLAPQPGFFFGANGKPSPREVLRDTPFGRIAFANTDLSGVMDHRYSIQEASRAVEQLLGQVLTSV